MDKLYIVIPAYNEADNLEMLMNDWYPIIENSQNKDSRLVVVNDGSKDNTYDILCRMAKERPMLKVLDKKNGGHGSAVLFGYRYAIENGADYIFQTDSDGQTRPEEFQAFWSLRDQYDAIIGNRPTRGDGFSRLVVEKVLCIVLFVIFGVKISDSNAPFRLMKRELLEKYIDKLPVDFFLPNVMFTTYFKYYGENMKFVDITFESRKGGSNSINIPKICKIGIRAVKDFRQLRRDIAGNGK